MSKGVKAEWPDENGPGGQRSKINTKGPKEHLPKCAIRQGGPQKDIGLADAGDEIDDQLVSDMHDGSLQRQYVQIDDNCQIPYNPISKCVQQRYYLIF